MDRKERKETFLKLADLVDQAGEVFSHYLQNPSDSSRLEEIEKIEQKGDILEDKLNTYYMTQRNIPYLSLDRAKLLRRLDEILDQMFLGAKTLEAFGTSLPESFTSKVTELAGHLDKMTKTLRQAIEAIYENFEEAAKLTKQIEYERDQSTNLLFELEKSSFQSEDGPEGWKGFVAVSRIGRRTVSIINATKAASEVIELMTMKYL
ncbi:MAG: DUF47 family protein [Candidatus Kariarchaeaceae archaeon]|jgi:uncharacterized protein Yka (UPF0111/DUF47 family)